MSELFTARYLILVRRAVDTYPRVGSTVRVVQGIGLHRTDKIVPNLTDEEGRTRRGCRAVSGFLANRFAGKAERQLVSRYAAKPGMR
jgi:hypothetical protein